MIKKVLLILFIAASNMAPCQEIEITLDIVWEGHSNVFDWMPDSTKVNGLQPFLSIRYANNTDRKVYFKDPIADIGGYPIIIGGGFIHSSFDLTELVSKHLNYDSSSFRYDFDQINSSWSITSNDKSNERGYSSALRTIYDLLLTQDRLDECKSGLALIGLNRPALTKITFGTAYQYVLNNNHPGNTSSFIFHEKDYLTESEVENDYKNQFVFIDENSRVVKKINLVAFLILGGSICFSIKDYEMKSYLVLRGNKLEFPKKVNDYEVFQGSFSSNYILFNTR